MSELQSFTEKLRAHLRKAEIGLCLQEIEKYIKKEPTNPFLNEFTMYSSQLTALEKAARKNTVTVTDLNVQTNQLLDNILEAINLLTDEHFDFTKKLKEEIHEKILVVCNGQAEMDRVKPFFKPEIFKGAEFTTDLTIDLEKAQSYRLIIFVNFSEGDVALHFDKILEKTIVEHKIHPILFFGTRTAILPKHPDKVYSANSKFSLLPRIREMLEYARLFPQDFTYYPEV